MDEGVTQLIAVQDRDMRIYKLQQMIETVPVENQPTEKVKSTEKEVELNGTVTPAPEATKPKEDVKEVVSNPVASAETSTKQEKAPTKAKTDTIPTKENVSPKPTEPEYPIKKASRDERQSEKTVLTEKALPNTAPANETKQPAPPVVQPKKVETPAPVSNTMSSQDKSAIYADDNVGSEKEDCDCNACSIM